MKETKSYIGHLFKQYRPIVILYAILGIINYPLRLLLEQLSIKNIQYQLTDLPYDYYPSSLAILMVVLGAITPFIVLDFIYDKNKMDTYFALPIKREKLFLNHFLFGWLLQVGTIVISIILGFIIIQSTDYDFVHFMSGPYGLSRYLVWLGILILGSLILQIPSTISILCTTNLFNGIIYAVVLHALPSTILAVWQLYMTDFYGYTGPEGSFYGDAYNSKFEFHTTYISSIEDNSVKEYLGPIIIWFVVALALLVLCSYLFKKHKVERTDTAYMVKGFYPTMISIYGILLLLMVVKDAIYNPNNDGAVPKYEINLFNSNLITIFFIAFAVYFVIQIIRYHGLPKIGRTILMYLIIFVIAVAISYFGQTSIAKSLELKQPQRKDIAKVELTSADITAINIEYLPYEEKVEILENLDRKIEAKEAIYFYPLGEIVYYEQEIVEDPESIDKIYQIHADIAKNTGQRKLDILYAIEEYPNIRLKYFNKDNELLMTRTYYLAEGTKYIEAIEEASGIVFPLLDDEFSNFDRGKEAWSF